MDASQPRTERRTTARLPPTRPQGRVALYREPDGTRTLRALIRLSGGRVEAIAAYRPGPAVPLSETRVVLLPLPASAGQRLDALEEVRRACEAEATVARMRGGAEWVGEWAEAALRVRYVAGVWRAEMRRAG